MDKEIIHKEIDLVQAVINRMASNSFEVKKWLIGILTALVVFKHDELVGGNEQFIFLLLIPVFCFWYLDAFFLSTERKYREMYKWVVKYRKQTDLYLYDLNSMKREFPAGKFTNFINEKNDVLTVMFSETILPFYLVPIAFIVALGVLNYFK